MHKFSLNISIKINDKEYVNLSTEGTLDENVQVLLNSIDRATQLLAVVQELKSKNNSEVTLKDLLMSETIVV